MSKSIEVSDQDYARIQQAADADGMPVDAWVVENLPLNGNGPAADAPLPDPDGKPARTMADLFAGLTGVVNSRHPEQPTTPASAETKPKRTMADRFAGRVGLIDSGGDGLLSQNTGEKFTDYLEEKRRAGRL